MTEFKIISKQDASLLEQIAQIERAEFSQPLSIQELTACAQKDFYKIFALIKQGEILAYAVFCFCADEAQILSVASAQKRHGYAYALLLQCIESLRQNASRINLEVRKSNIAAQRLYQKLGFQLAGYRKNLYEKPVEDGHIMYLEMKKCEYSE